MNPDHYAVLGVNSSASVVDIKAAFRSAALRLHPDKNAVAAAATDAQQPPGAASEDEFIRVQQAWRVLGDPQARAEYHRQLAIAAAQQAVSISEVVGMAEMERCLGDTGEACLSWPCRCSGAYLIVAEECESAGAEGVVVPCSTCSLHIHVVPEPSHVAA